MVVPARRVALHTDSISASSDLSTDLMPTYVQPPTAASRSPARTTSRAHAPPSSSGTIQMHLKFGTRAVEHVAG